MGNAFCCIVEKSKKVTWKFGVDSHTLLLYELAGLPDNTAEPAEMLFARVEITPDNNSYLAPDNWSLRVDESITPTWLTQQHKEACFAAHKEWVAKLNKVLVRKEIVHPFELTPPKIGPAQIKLLKQCVSVKNSMDPSIEDSIGGSVDDSLRTSVVEPSVRDSVEAFVRAHVRGSEQTFVRSCRKDPVRDYSWEFVESFIEDSVEAYIGSFFILPNWKYIKHKQGEYPFSPWVKLWEQGLVVSFDGTTWQLHGGVESEILYELKPEVKQ